MRPRLLALPAALLVAASASADAAGVDVALGALAGGGGSNSYTASASLTAGPHWTLGAGAGSSRAAGPAGSLSGTQWDVSADVHASWIGLEARYAQWDDSGNFGAETPAATLYLQRDALRFEALGEWPRYRIDYQLTLLGRTLDRSYSFSASGYGAGLSWNGEHWQAYVRGLDYRYGDQIDRLAAIVQSPDLAHFPRLAALLGSVATLTQGALDYQYGAGLGASYGRYGPHFDWQHVRDAIGGVNADSYTLGLRFALSERCDLDLGGGVTRSAVTGDQGFGSLTLGIHW